VLVRQLARRQHELPILPVDDVAVVVHVLELVVGPDLLQLREGAQQWAVVPEPDVLEGDLVARQRARVEVLVGGELLLLDAVEPVSGAGHPDVGLDVRPLGLQLVGRHAQALQERRVHPEAHHPHHEQRGAGAREQAQPRPHDLRRARDGGERGQYGQRAEHRQRGVDVGVRGAEDEAARREDDLVAVEPEADGLEGQQRRAQQQQVRARAAGQARAARGQHEAALEHVHGEGQHRRARHQRHCPRVGEPPERQEEHEEAQIEAEHGILEAERRAVEVAENGLPVRARAQPRDDGDQQQDDGQEAPDERLDHHASRQAELILQLPQDVGGGGARRQREVGPEEEGDGERDGGEERAAQREGGQEDLAVADLLEPQPVGVERDELQQHRQHHQRDDEQRQGWGGAHRTRPARGATSRAARRRGTTPDPA